MSGSFRRSVIATRIHWHRRTAVILSGLVTATGLTLAAAPAASAVTPDDYYRITSTLTGLAIDVASSATGNDARVVQSPVSLDSKSQDWRVVQAPGGYELHNANSDKCLSVYQNSTAAGAHLVQHDCQGLTGQRWTVPAGNIGGSEALRSVLDGYFVDVPGGTLAPDTWLQVRPGTGTGGSAGEYQSFYMVRVDV